MEMEVPAEARCPYCGALSSSADEPDDAAALEVLRRLAALWEIDSLYVGLLLLRVRHSTMSLREISRRLGCTAAGGHRLLLRLRAYSPDLARFVRGGGTKPRGMEGGRHKAARQNDEGGK